MTKINIHNRSLKICGNCVRNTYCGHYMDDISVKYCIPHKKSVYTDTDATDCTKFDTKYPDYYKKN